MTRHEQEQAIAADLALCDMIDAFGTRKAKRQAKAQRQAIQAQIKAWIVEDGLADVSLDDLRNELAEFAA